MRIWIARKFRAEVQCTFVHAGLAVDRMMQLMYVRAHRGFDASTWVSERAGAGLPFSAACRRGRKVFPSLLSPGSRLGLVVCQGHRFPPEEMHAVQDFK
jgi:hypothetical protein